MSSLELRAPGLAPVVALARRVASVPASMLIIAEPGAPVEALARLIHAETEGGSRVAWSSVHPTEGADALLEAELFGPDGAAVEPAGAPPRAANRTLFIDPIQNLSLPSQARLVALLLDASGGSNNRSLRVIAATAADLDVEVRHGRFRSDLLDLLSAITITIPPLRRRPSDIMVLANAIARAEAEALGRRFEGFSDGAQARLSVHTYPRNEEELSRIVRRTISATSASTIDASSITLDTSTTLMADVFVDDVARSSSDATGRVPTLSEIERAYIVWALRYTNLNRTAAARLLGISYPTIAKKIIDYGIDVASLA